MVKHILIELDDNEYEELVRLKGRKTWKQFVLDLARGAKIEVSSGAGEIKIDTDRILKAIERKIDDLLNPYTGKIDDLAKRVGKLESGLGLVIEKVNNIERALQEGSAEAEKKEEKVVKRESKSEKKMDAIDYLKRDKVTYESNLAKKDRYKEREARDGVFEKLERAGAIVFALKDERVAVDPDFWKRFVEKIQNITTNNEDEVKKALTKKEYGLLVKMRESGLIWFDTTINRWVIEKELLAKTATKLEQKKEKRESGESVLSEEV